MAMAEGPEKLGIGEGEQVLITRESLSEPLDYLPDAAFESAVIVSTQGDPTAVEERVLSADVDPGRVTVIPVSGSNLRYDGVLDPTERVGPNDLTGVGVRITEALDGGQEPPWVVIDNLNVFLMYAADDRVYRFLDTVVGKTRSVGGRGAYFSVTEALVDDTEAKLRQLVDRAIEHR